MKKDDNVFRDLVGSFDQESYRERGLRVAEEACVKNLLSALGMPQPTKWKLIEHANNTLGVKKLTLESFQALFPTFPYLLSFAQIPKFESKVTVGKAFCSFSKSPVLDVFLEAFEGFDDCNRCALFVPRKGVPRGLVVHNGPIPMTMEEGKPKKDKSPVGALLWVFFANEIRLVIERADTFLFRLRGWSP